MWPTLVMPRSWGGEKKKKEVRGSRDAPRSRVGGEERYLQVSPLQQDQLGALDVVPDENVSVLPQTQRFQPRSHLLSAPLVRWRGGNPER